MPVLPLFQKLDDNDDDHQHCLEHFVAQTLQVSSSPLDVHLVVVSAAAAAIAKYADGHVSPKGCLE